MELPALYASNNSLPRLHAEDTLKEYIPRMKWNNNEAVLEVGCGPGDLTRDILLPSLPSSGCRIVGVDFAPQMVEYAATNSSHDSIEYQVFNIATKEDPRQTFPDGFSKIFSSYCLHWVQDHNTWMKNIFSLLRPSGEALLIFPGRNPVTECLKHLSKVPDWAQFIKDVSEFKFLFLEEGDSVELLTRTAKEAGFEVVSCEAVEKTFDFESITHFRRFISSINSPAARMTGEIKEKYVDTGMEFIQEYNKKNRDPEAVLRYTLLVTHLQKPM